MKLYLTGDDEQSDFYYEAGPACGIPGVIPWWENEKHSENGDSEMDPNFQKILTGSFDYLTNSSQRNFKTRVSKLLARVSISKREETNYASSKAIKVILEFGRKFSEAFEEQDHIMIMS